MEDVPEDAEQQPADGQEPASTPQLAPPQAAVEAELLRDAASDTPAAASAAAAPPQAEQQVGQQVEDEGQHPAEQQVSPAAPIGHADGADNAALAGGDLAAAEAAAEALEAAAAADRPEAAAAEGCIPGQPQREEESSEGEGEEGQPTLGSASTALSAAQQREARLLKMVEQLKRRLEQFKAGGMTA